MAFEMEYEDKAGVVHPHSYWRVVSVNICQSSKTANIIFYGYSSKNARDEGREGVGIKMYPISSLQYDEWFSTGELNPLDRNPVRVAYEYALQCPEIADDVLLPSFFVTATEV